MKVSDKVRIGVAGAGKMGQNHIRVLTQLNGTFDVKGIYDPLTEKKAVADKYGIAFYEKYEDMLKDVDAVTLPCPTSLHKEMALKAAEYGVHTLVEKPIAETLKDAKSIQNAFKRKNLLLTVGYVERFNPVVAGLLEVLKEYEPIAIEVHRCSPFDKRIFDVDVVADLMIHDIDIIVNGIENCLPKWIDAHGRRVYTDKFADYAQAAMQFPDGVQAFITTSRATEDKIRTIAVHAKGAYIEADLLNRTLVVKHGTSYDLKSTAISYRQSSVTEHLIVENTEPLREELLCFGNAILKDEQLLVNSEQVLRSMKVLETVEKKMYSHMDGIA